MTTDSSHAKPSKSEVRAAVLAMLMARAALFPSAKVPSGPKKVSLRRPGSAAPPVASASLDTQSREASNEPVEPSPTPEAIEAAKEAALAAFPEDVRDAARRAYEETMLRLEGKLPAQARHTGLVRPSLIPTNLPQHRPSVVVPPFPTAGLDHPHVRAAWEQAHRDAAEARFLLQAPVLKAYAEARLACERWDSKERGRKPSGDLRHPVPRDRLGRITEEMRREHERVIARAVRTVGFIETGDVVGVKFFGTDGDDDDGIGQVPMFVLQSDLDRKAVEQRTKANRTPEQIAADAAKWDEMVEGLLADLPEKEPDLVIPNLPELPSGREPTASEVAALDYAIRKHLRYLERGEQIEAKRRKDAATKVRTAAKRDAEKANPEGTAAAKKAVHLNKAAERQRRWRERKKTGKDGDR